MLSLCRPTLRTKQLQSGRLAHHIANAPATEQRLKVASEQIKFGSKNRSDVISRQLAILITFFTCMDESENDRENEICFFFKKKLPDNTLAEHDLEAQHKTESVILCLR